MNVTDGIDQRCECECRPWTKWYCQKKGGWLSELQSSRISLSPSAQTNRQTATANVNSPPAKRTTPVTSPKSSAAHAPTVSLPALSTLPPNVPSSSASTLPPRSTRAAVVHPKGPVSTAHKLKVQMTSRVRWVNASLVNVHRGTS